MNSHCIVGLDRLFHSAMRYLGFLFVLALAGCSNAPLAGTLDCLVPSKVGKNGPGNPKLAGEPLPPPNLPTRPEDPLPPRGSLESNPKKTEEPWKPLNDRPGNTGLGDPLPAPLPAPGYVDR